jgi:hypothetical protein
VSSGPFETESQPRGGVSAGMFSKPRSHSLRVFARPTKTTFPPGPEFRIWPGGGGGMGFGVSRPCYEARREGTMFWHVIGQLNSYRTHALVGVSTSSGSWSEERSFFFSRIAGRAE